MRIAIWLEQDSSGGVDTHLKSLLQNWPANLNQFVIFTNSDNPSFDRYKSWKTNVGTEVVLVKRLPAGSFWRLVSETLFLPLYIWLTSKRVKNLICKHGKFDVFVANNGAYPGSWTTLGALRAAHQLGIRKRILLVHHQAVPRKPMMNTIESIVDRRVMSWLTGTISVSHATRNSLVSRRDFDLVKRSIRVIYNGVDCSGVIASGKLAELLMLESKVTTAAMLGRVELYKGHEELIRAIALLPDQLRANFKLLIIGFVEQSISQYLRDMTVRLGIENCVEICGFIDIESSAIIAEIDVLVCATQEFEGFGYTVLEAMSVGTPVITTDIGGISEYCDERFGVLVRPGSVQELADAIENVVVNQAETRQRVVAASKQASNFSGKKTATEFYREFLI